MKLISQNPLVKQLTNQMKLYITLKKLPKKTLNNKSFVEIFGDAFNKVYFYMIFSILAWNAREVILLVKDDNYFISVMNLWGNLSIALSERVWFTINHIIGPAVVGYMISIVMPYITLLQNKLTAKGYAHMRNIDEIALTNIEIAEIRKLKKSENINLKGIVADKVRIKAECDKKEAEYDGTHFCSSQQARKADFLAQHKRYQIGV